MKKIINLVVSTRTTVILLVIFALAMAVATFIEDKYDTATAKTIIYNAYWFEVMLLLLAVNFIGNIFRFRLLSRQKIAIFLFHAAFALMLFGAFITRYFGYEGSIHIREGQSGNVMYSPETALQIRLADGNGDNTFNVPFNYTEKAAKEFHLEVNTGSKGMAGFKIKKYIKNATEVINDLPTGGNSMAELIYATNAGRESFFIQNGEVKNIGQLVIAYNVPGATNVIHISTKKDSLSISFPYPVVRTDMNGGNALNINTGSETAFVMNEIFQMHGAMFALTNFHKHAEKKLVEGTGEQKNPDAMLLDITINGKATPATVFGGPGYNTVFQKYIAENITFQIGYGEKAISLPFSLRLRDFILERYPGSTSPSSYASEVTLIDSRNNLNKDFRIFMNNVLDYDGYRFFQSSYDMDERGTILSVNHDFWGTWVTYTGYLLMTIGFILTLISKNSRFAVLRKKIRDIRVKRKSAMTAVLFLLSAGIAESQNAVDAKHADNFGHLLVQTYDGRIEPMHSLAIDIIHKISRKDKFTTTEKGTLNAMQMFLDMSVSPEYWKKQPVIYIKDKSVRKAIGVTEKYACFDDFITEQGQYKLSELVEKAFRKKQSEQNEFDKDIIKVDERLNICMMVFQGTMMKVFPLNDDLNSKWVGFGDSLAKYPVKGMTKFISDDLHLNYVTYAGILQLYMEKLTNAVKTNNYSEPDKILKYISGFQRKADTENVLPGDSRVAVEVFYNKAGIFIFLRNCYAILCLIISLLAFIDNYSKKSNKNVNRALTFFTVLLGAAFLYHTFGMILRWYISGHAPWSNGYEALLLIAWGGLLAGFFSFRYSKITLAATSILAFLTLMTASHSSYDPQITNLQPVLKSYWLIIHVATLTVSYGFFGLGFILALINFFIYIFYREKNYARLSLISKELTNINEFNMIIGIALATVGTFLGGVWANESWGRYWGWDAKETWALIIVVTYAIVLHLRLVPKMGHDFAINVGAIFGFGTVIMTFVGVNYYLSKGLHSYGAGDTPVFPIWAWIMILSIIGLMVFSWFRFKSAKQFKEQE